MVKQIQGVLGPQLPEWQALFGIIDLDPNMVRQSIKFDPVQVLAKLRFDFPSRRLHDL